MKIRDIQLGRHVLGLAGILLGVITLWWREFDFGTWQQIAPLGNVPHREALACVAGVIELSGGLAIQWRKTARAGALILAGILSFFALMWLLSALARPLVWAPWGSIFELCSAIAGALIVYASFDRDNPPRAARMTRFAYLAFGICVFFFLFGDVPAFCKCH